LDLTVEEAADFFEKHSKVMNVLKVLEEV